MLVTFEMCHITGCLLFVFALSEGSKLIYLFLLLDNKQKKELRAERKKREQKERQNKRKEWQKNLQSWKYNKDKEDLCCQFGLIAPVFADFPSSVLLWLHPFISYSSVKSLSLLHNHLLLFFFCDMYKIFKKNQFVINRQSMIGKAL